MSHSVQLLSDDKSTLAKNLVYRVYIEEYSWFPDNNKSNIRIVEDQGLKVLIDDFDKVSTWFGVFHNNAIIACCRLSDRLDGKFEVERYQSLPRFITQETSACELNRFAMLREYRTEDSFIAMLYNYVLGWANQHGILVISTGVLPGSKLIAFGMEHCKEVPPFLYSPNDQEARSIFYAMPSNMPL